MIDTKDMGSAIFFKRNGYLPTPKVLQIEITNYCPLNCPQCYKKREVFNIQLDVFKEIINEAAILGVKKIMLNGGETTVHPHFWDIIRFVEKNNIIPVCFTSGFNIDCKFLDNLRKSKLELYLSFNGSNDFINGKSRDGFDITLKAAELLCKNHIQYSVNWVARHDNVRDFPELIALLKGLRCENIEIESNKVTSNNYIESELTFEDYMFLREVIKKNTGFIKVQNCYNMLGRLLEELPKNRLYGCPAGIMSMFVSMDKEFAPCSHLNYREKNFVSIAQYWEKSDILKELRNSNPQELGQCKECVRDCVFCRANNVKTMDDLAVGMDSCPLYKRKE